MVKPFKSYRDNRQKKKKKKIIANATENNIFGKILFRAVIIIIIIIISPRTASSPLNSSDTALNSSSVSLGMIHRVLMAMAINHEKEPLADHLVCNVPERGATNAGNGRERVLLLTRGGARLLPSRLPLTSPTHSWVYKCTRQPAVAEFNQQQLPLLLQEVPSPFRRF